LYDSRSSLFKKVAADELCLRSTGCLQSPGSAHKAHIGAEKAFKRGFGPSSMDLPLWLPASAEVWISALSLAAAIAAGYIAYRSNQRALDYAATLNERTLKAAAELNKQTLEAASRHVTAQLVNEDLRKALRELHDLLNRPTDHSLRSGLEEFMKSQNAMYLPGNIVQEISKQIASIKEVRSPLDIRDREQTARLQLGGLISQAIHNPLSQQQSHIRALGFALRKPKRSSPRKSRTA
jgi:hypothetical protein